MKPFSLLIKPASADCNLRCRYCFYLDHAALYPDTRVHRMSGEVLERMISTYLATEQEQYAFGWQGGEPTLMGLEFFQRVTDLQQKYGRARSIVSNGLQTNGTLLDQKFARHLSRYHFLVGVSLDGPAHLHDHYRKTRRAGGTHADVIRGIRHLEANRVEFNILTLVNSVNVKKPVEIYRYLRGNGWLYHQYIPCVEFDENSRPLPWTITGEAWGDFLCAIFDEWVRSDVTRVSIRLFDAVLTHLVEGRAIICHMGRSCCQYFVVEYNGDIYPCDFFVEAPLKLGNVLDSSWEEIQAAEKYLGFGSQKSLLNDACSRCAYLSYCSGDCLKYRFHSGNDPRNRSWLCEGWKRFYGHCLPAFQRIAKRIKAERAAAQPAARAVEASAFKNVGRNDPCPCGSGRKYKKCCMARRAS